MLVNDPAPSPARHDGCEKDRNHHAARPLPQKKAGEAQSLNCLLPTREAWRAANEGRFGVNANNRDEETDPHPRPARLARKSLGCPCPTERSRLGVASEVEGFLATCGELIGNYLDEWTSWT